jgi:hypothetical protein
LSMPLFGANGDAGECSPDTFNLLTPRVLLEMKTVTTPFYTQASTAQR